MRRQVRRATGKPLTDRGRIALLWLDEYTKPGAAQEWDRRHETAPSYKLADVLRKQGLRSRGHSFDSDTVGAGQVLVGLKRRGLAENDGGGAWLSAQWSITEAGCAEAKRLREVDSE